MRMSLRLAIMSPGGTGKNETPMRFPLETVGTEMNSGIPVF